MTVYIYGLRCPISGGIRYIGKTKASLSHRLKGHIRKAVKEKVRGHCQAWIRKLDRRGLEPSIEQVFEVPEADDWRHHEMRLIKEFKDFGCDLTNATAGGDGFHDVKDWVTKKRVISWRRTMSNPERRKRMVESLRAAWANPERLLDHAERMALLWANPSYREKMLYCSQTDEARKKRSEAALLRYKNPAERELQRSRARVRMMTPKGRKDWEKMRAGALLPSALKKRAAAMRLAYRSGDLLERITLSNAEINSRPEVRQKKSAAMKAQWSTPDSRAKWESSFSTDECKRRQSESKKKAWLDPEKRARLMNRWTPEARDKQAKVIENRSTPEYRAMMAEKTRLAWIKRKANKGA